MIQARPEPTGDASEPVQRPRPARAPAIVNLAITTALAVAVSALAYAGRQGSPPPIAEFAPRAIEQVQDTPEEQDEAPEGGDPGAAAPVGAPAETETSEDEAPEPTESATEEPTDEPTKLTEEQKARVRRCVGTPPRQTEDPQSPPCVAFFDGDDNGGATSLGVTADEIVIALPKFTFFGEDEPQFMDPMLEHFNQRYEFYGRKLTLAYFDPTGGNFASPVPADMQADAVKVASELGAFASLAYTDRKAAEHHYYDELARNGVISILDRMTNVGTEARFQQFDPYQWTYGNTVDTQLRTWGSFVCESLNGKDIQAGGAGGLLGADPMRRFGLVLNRSADGSIPPVAAFTDVLDACGAEILITVEDATVGGDHTSVVLQLADAGVNSVLCLCSPNSLRQGYMAAATQQAYFPEWVVSDFINNDLDNSFDGATPEQAEAIIGLTTWNVRRPRQEMFWYRVIKEHAAPGTPDPDGTIYYSYASRYAQLLLLASGIQAAGPDLTPESFAAGLRSLTFANPGAGAPPFFQGAVGFRNSHAMLNGDAYLFWYSASTTGTINTGANGAICPVALGARHERGSFPDVVPFYQGSCK